MNISGLFVRRPVATALLTIGTAFFGVLAYLSCRYPICRGRFSDHLGERQHCPARAPKRWRAPWQRRWRSNSRRSPSLDSMSPSAARALPDHAAVRARPQHRRAAQDVQTAIATASRQLPPDMPTPPSFRKVNPADSSVLFSALSSRRCRSRRSTRYAENAARAAHLDAAGRGAGADLRSAEIRRARAARSRTARGAWHRRG